MNESFIRCITVTGADDSIDPTELDKITMKYPFVEFGILLSKNSMGTPRFPSKEWLQKLAKLNESSSIDNFSAHVCGQWVRDILVGNYPDWQKEIGIKNSFFDIMFSRYQLNTHGVYHEFDLNKIRYFLNSKNVIFQYDEVNTDLIFTSMEEGIREVSVLFDISHGNGKLPENWPIPLEGVFCGYAGGLSPDNLEENLIKLEKLVGEDWKIWVDAETHLRSNYGTVFDLNKVEKFLEIAKPWVWY